MPPFDTTHRKREQKPAPTVTTVTEDVHFPAAPMKPWPAGTTWPSEEAQIAAERQRAAIPVEPPPVHPPQIVHVPPDKHSRILLYAIAILLLLVWMAEHGWAQAAVNPSGQYFWNPSTGKWTAVSSVNPLPTSSSGGGSNACASATGAAVPASSCYAGLNIGGTLQGQTGVSLSAGSIFAAHIDLESLGGVLLGAMANYGTSPGAVKVPGVNAFITNSPAVTGSGIFEVSPTTAANTLANEFFAGLSDGTNLIGVSAHPLFSNTSQIGGSAISTAATGVQKVGIVGNAGAAVDAATGSAVPANALQVCGTDGTNCTVPFIDPCQRGAKTFVNFNQTGNTKVLSGVSAKKWYICSILVPEVTAASSISLVEGTGSTCGTNTIAVSGVTGGSGTAATGAVLIANQGFAFGSGESAVGQTSVNADDVCLFESNSVQISGGMTAVNF
jgi:hypothetical protein